MRFRSCPPRVMAPADTSQNPAISLAMVDLPEPEGPTKAVMVPEGMVRDTSWRTSLSA